MVLEQLWRGVGVMEILARWGDGMAEGRLAFTKIGRLAFAKMGREQAKQAGGGGSKTQPKDKVFSQALLQYPC